MVGPVNDGASEDNPFAGTRSASGFLDPAVGYVGLDARQSPDGDWHSVVVYNSNDFERPEVKANHLIVYAMLMPDTGE